MTAQTVDFRISPELQADLRQWRKRALIAGAVGTVLSAIGFLIDHDQFYRSYLWSYLYIVGLTVGPLAWLMLQYVTGGNWGVILRRPLEAGTRTLPLVALLFVPLALGLPDLYSWANPTSDRWKDNHHLQKQLHHLEPYLNSGFFLARTALYFAIWISLARSTGPASPTSRGSVTPRRRILAIHCRSAAGSKQRLLTM